VADELAALDWEAPWFEPWREPGSRIAAQCGEQSIHEALNAHEAEAPVRFVPQSDLPPGEAYESHIFSTGACPTRDNLHDFFNGLCWIHFPRSKKRFNELHEDEIGRDGIRAVRGPVRDAITILDENGALLHAPPLLWEALRARDWHRLFVELRPLWSQARLVIFGHALLEKLVRPRKELTAHVWCANMPAGNLAAMDAALAEALSADRLAAKPYTPLPVLGIPGWCEQNQNFSFYDDSFVFRAAGTKNARTTRPPAAPRP
jgi:hypothetical protein